MADNDTTEVFTTIVSGITLEWPKTMSKTDSDPAIKLLSRADSLTMISTCATAHNPNFVIGRIRLR